MYQIANIYLLLFAGSIWDSLAEAIENPKAILSLISAALPKVSIFFINYIITIWLSGVPYKMIRRFCAIQYLYYRSCTSTRALTRRMLKCAEGPFGETRVNYGTELSDILYVLCVVMLYWVIAPIVLILATGLFWSWYFTWKYQYVFVITRTHESGGLFWYKIYRYSMLGLMAGTITFMAYMGIKEGISQGPLLMPLPIIIYVSWRYTEKCFRNQSKNLAFGMALRQEKDWHNTEIVGLEEAQTVRSTGVSTDRTHSQDRNINNPLRRSIHSDPLVDAPHAPEDAHHSHASVSSLATGSTTSNSVLLRFRENFMKQPNLMFPPRIYPYPYRLYNIPLLDQYGALNEIYLDEIPEGVDPATLFPEASAASYTHLSAVLASDHAQTMSNRSSHQSRTSASAELMVPLSHGQNDEVDVDMHDFGTGGEADSLL